MNKNNTHNTENTAEKSEIRIVGFRRAVPIILFAAAIFIALCFITQSTGLLGKFIGKVFLGLFSWGAYSIPLLLAVHGIFYYRDIGNKCVTSRAVFSIITVLALSALAFTISTFGEEIVFNGKAAYENGTQGVGGGFIGSLLSFVLMKMFGSVGMIIIAAAVFALYISFFFAKSKKASGKFLYFLLAMLVSAIAFVEKTVKKAFSSLKNVKLKKKAEQQKSRNEELFADQFFEVDNGMKELNIPKLGIREARTNTTLEDNPTLQDKVYHKSGFEPKDEPTDTFVYTEAAYDTADNDDGTAFRGGSTIYDDYRPEGEQTQEPVFSSPRDEERVRNRERNRMYGLDENAEDVFTKDFNPFDFAAGEALASRPSSKSVSAGTDRGIGNPEESLYRRPIDTISDEEIENARRLYDVQMKREAAIADFEAKKRAALERMRHQATPVTNSAVQTGEVKSVEFKIDGADVIDRAPEKSVYHASYEKQEQADVPNDERMSTTESASETYATAPEFPVKDSYDLARDATASASTVFTFDTAGASEEESIPDETNGSMTSEEQGNLSTDSSSDEIFAPICNDTESDGEPDPFTPFSEVTDLIEDRGLEADELLHTERSMLSPTLDFDDEDDELDSPDDETSYEEDASAPTLIPEDERNPEVAALRKSFPFLSDIPEDEEKGDEIDEPPFAAEPAPKASEQISFTPVKAAQRTEPAKAEPEKSTPAKPDFSTYVPPSIDMLTKGEKITESTDEEIQENATRLIETLLSFNVKVSIKGVDRGPRITRYEVVPGHGVKVTQVTNLENDIKLNLAAEGMRIKAPIPGKAAIGIEIPNKKSEIVRLRDLIETEEYQTASSKTFFCIGKDVAGYPVFNDIEKMPHMLVAGATGMGKSVFINSLMISLLYKARPDEVRFIMIDPKKLEFNMYNGIPHLLVPVVTETKQAAGALQWAVDQMNARYDIMGKLNVRNIGGYNEKVKKYPELGEPLTRIIIVIDEFADLMLQAKDPVEKHVMSLAQKARAAGIHLVIGTQRPSVNVLTGVIKANIPSRFTCKVVSNVDSRTIIEQAGAEKLLNRGDMLYMSPGMDAPERIQSAYVSDGEVEEIMEYLKTQSNGASYDTDVLDEINRQAAILSKEADGDDRDERDSGSSGEGYLNDRQFLDAVEVAVNTGKISTSLLQRKISIGFGKAAKFIDIMEDMGVVSGPNGQKPRDVLLTPDEWHEKLARTELD